MITKARTGVTKEPTDELHGAIDTTNSQRRTRRSIRRLNHILIRKFPEPHARIQLLHRICLLHHYWNSNSLKTTNSN